MRTADDLPGASLRCIPGTGASLRCISGPGRVPALAPVDNDFSIADADQGHIVAAAIRARPGNELVHAVSACHVDKCFGHLARMRAARQRSPEYARITRRAFFFYVASHTPELHHPCRGDTLHSQAAIVANIHSCADIHRGPAHSNQTAARGLLDDPQPTRRSTSSRPKPPCHQAFPVGRGSARQ